MNEKSISRPFCTPFGQQKGKSAAQNNKCLSLIHILGAALDEARKAAALGEVPVGAVVARNGQIVAAAHNTRETEKNEMCIRDRYRASCCLLGAAGFGVSLKGAFADLFQRLLAEEDVYKRQPLL